MYMCHSKTHWLFHISDGCDHHEFNLKTFAVYILQGFLLFLFLTTLKNYHLLAVTNPFEHQHDVVVTILSASASANTGSEVSEKTKLKQKVLLKVI